MYLSSMRFAGYEWRTNPTFVQMMREVKAREDRENEVMSITDVYSDVTVYRGEGELVGKDCMEQYRELEKVFLQNRKGILSVPEVMPFEAYFTQLSIICRETPDIIRYSFEFRRNAEKPAKTKGEFYICEKGETLYDIAYYEDIPLETLTKLNPHIRNLVRIPDGEQVRLC